MFQYVNQSNNNEQKHMYIMKKIVGWLTFSVLQTSVIEIQTREGWQKKHESLLITNHAYYITMCQSEQK